VQRTREGGQPQRTARYQLNREEERWYFKYRVSELM